MNSHSPVFLLRCPRNSASLVCLLRIRLADRAALALLYGRDHDGVARAAALCAADPARLAAHPLHLLALVFELRLEGWTRWMAQLWGRVNDAETATNMTSASWKRRVLPPARRAALVDTDGLLVFLHSTHTELAHAGNVVAFAGRLAAVCRAALDAVEDARARRGGLPALSGRARAGFEARVGFSAARCEAVRDRLTEMRERLQGQIQVVRFCSCPWTAASADDPRSLVVL